MQCDKGPEFTGKVLMSWAAQKNIMLRFIQSGKSQQNVYIGLYDQTELYSWLGQSLFNSLNKLQGHATQW